MSHTPEHHPAVAKKHPTSKRRIAWNGWGYMAISLLTIMGVFSIIIGFVALINGQLFAASLQANFVTLAQWGTLQVCLGVVLVAGALFLARHPHHIRIVGLALVTLSLVINLIIMQTYPLWLFATLAVSIAIGYGALRHGDTIQQYTFSTPSDSK